MNILTKREEAALKYYIGDVKGDHEFYGDPKAYVLLNSLFFPEILSESARAAEGKLLNPAIISDIPRLMGFFEALFSAFGKARLKESVTTYRVERASDFEIARKLGMTVSMTSTSMSGFLDSYRDRRAISLMRFELPKGGQFINVGEVLGYYAKPEEAEILLPPFTRLRFEEISLTAEEKLITDCDGKSPVISVKAKADGIAESEIYNGEILHCPEGIRVCTALNAKKQPDAEDVLVYSDWKRTLRSKLYGMFCESFTDENAC